MKLNNLLPFKDFTGELPSNKQKKTKRTEIGLDVINEGLEKTSYTKKDMEKCWYASRSKRFDTGVTIYNTFNDWIKKYKK